MGNEASSIQDLQTATTDNDDNKGGSMRHLTSSPFNTNGSIDRSPSLKPKPPNSLNLDIKQSSIYRRQSSSAPVSIEGRRTSVLGIVNNLLKGSSPEPPVSGVLTQGGSCEDSIFTKSDLVTESAVVLTPDDSYGSQPQSPVTPPSPDLSHLTDEEKLHIAEVLGRVKQFEKEEDERLRDMENDISSIAESVSTRCSSQDVRVFENVCPICARNELVSDEKREHICNDCKKKVCGECGTFNSDPGAAFAEWLCNICQKRRQLIQSSGMWFHGLRHASTVSKGISLQDLLKNSGSKPKLERTASYSYYEEIIETDKKSKPIRAPMTKMASLPNRSPEEEKPMILVENEYSTEDAFQQSNSPSSMQIKPDYKQVKMMYLKSSDQKPTQPAHDFMFHEDYPTDELEDDEFDMEDEEEIYRPNNPIYSMDDSSLEQFYNYDSQSIDSYQDYQIIEPEYPQRQHHSQDVTSSSRMTNPNLTPRQIRPEETFPYSPPLSPGAFDSANNLQLNESMLEEEEEVTLKSYDYFGNGGSNSEDVIYKMPTTSRADDIIQMKRGFDRAMDNSVSHSPLGYEDETRGDQWAMDIASYAAAIANDTDSLITQAMQPTPTLYHRNSSPPKVDTESRDVSESYAVNSSDEEDFSDEDESLILRHTYSSTDQRSPYEQQDSHVFPLQSQNPSSVIINPGDRSASADLSPIEDVSPSLEEAEAEFDLNTQFHGGIKSNTKLSSQPISSNLSSIRERRSSNTDTSIEESEHQANTFIKRCQNYDDISSLTRANQMKPTEQIKTESPGGDGRGYESRRDKEKSKFDAQTVGQEEADYFQEYSTLSSSPSPSSSFSLSPGVSYTHLSRECAADANSSTPTKLGTLRDNKESTVLYKNPRVYPVVQNSNLDMEDNTSDYENTLKLKKSKTISSPRETDANRPAHSPKSKEDFLQITDNMCETDSGLSTPDSQKASSRRRLPQVPIEELVRQERSPSAGNRKEQLFLVKARLLEKQNELSDRSPTTSYCEVGGKNVKPSSNEDYSSSSSRTILASPTCSVVSSTRTAKPVAKVNVRGLLVPKDVLEKKSVVLRELLLVTQPQQTNLNGIENIRKLERRIEEIREIEKTQMTQIQQKLADIMNTRRFGEVQGHTYPSYSSSLSKEDLPLFSQRRKPMYIPPPLCIKESKQKIITYSTTHPSWSDYKEPFSPFIYIDDCRTAPQYLKVHPLTQNDGGATSDNNVLPKSISNYHESSLISRSTDQLKRSYLTEVYSPAARNLSALSDTRLADPPQMMDLNQKELRILELQREIEIRKQQIHQTLKEQEEVKMSSQYIPVVTLSQGFPHSVYVSEYSVQDRVIPLDNPRETAQQQHQFMSSYSSVQPIHNPRFSTTREATLFPFDSSYSDHNQRDYATAALLSPARNVHLNQHTGNTYPKPERPQYNASFESYSSVEYLNYKERIALVPNMPTVQKLSLDPRTSAQSYSTAPTRRESAIEFAPSPNSRTYHASPFPHHKTALTQNISAGVTMSDPELVSSRRETSTHTFPSRGNKNSLRGF